MSRRRMVNPEYFSDPLLVRTFTIEERYLFLGLWTLAEDSGCLDADPMGMKLNLFPGDLVAVDTADARALKKSGVSITLTISDALKKLVETERLIPYEVDGKPYLFIRHFHRWQRLDNPTPPKLPLPDFVAWWGEETYSEGEKGSKGYKKNRHRWHYECDLNGAHHAANGQKS